LDVYACDAVNPEYSAISSVFVLLLSCQWPIDRIRGYPSDDGLVSLLEHAYVRRSPASLQSFVWD
jgi:hypothetical protein